MAEGRVGVFAVPDATSPRSTLEQILVADRCGLDVVGIQDHPYQRRFFDTWTLLSYAAAHTERNVWSPTSSTSRCASRRCSPSPPLLSTC